MHCCPPSRLVSFATELLQFHGARQQDAHDVARYLVRASLAGHDSHGVLRIRKYIDKIRTGELVPTARPEVLRQHGAVATVSGNSGFGHLAAHFAAEVAGDLAEVHGIAGVALSQTTHIGRPGDFASQIAERGNVAVIMSGGAIPGGNSAPFGGRERIFGTNPMAWAIPVDGKPPVVSDFATSSIPEGKVAVARATGQPLPENTLLDIHGLPSTNPNDFYAGGVLLPFGGPKGSSLMLLVEVLTNLLSGSAPVSAPEYRIGNPTFMIAIATQIFVDRDEYSRLVADLLARIQSSKPAATHSRVLLPGQLERECTDFRKRDGIPIQASVLEDLKSLAHEAGIKPICAA